MSFFFFLLGTISLMMVLEGLIYALFPEHVQTMMRKVVTFPPETLRRFGALIAVTGFFALLALSSGLLQLGN